MQFIISPDLQFRISAISIKIEGQITHLTLSPEMPLCVCKIIIWDILKWSYKPGGLLCGGLI